MQQEMPLWSRSLPQLPRLVHRGLAHESADDLAPLLAEFNASQRWQNRLLAAIAVLLAAALVFLCFFFLTLH